MSENRPRLLIVDDTPDNIALLNGILRQTYKIKAASSGEKALMLAKNEPQPNLILLDIMMPEMDGYEVCRRLKADVETADIPVIFITAKDDEADERMGFDLGAVDYITKPVKPSIVQKRVATHLRLWQMQEELKGKNAALEEVARLRDDVEHITRHDLKTPLNSIIAVPAFLEKEYDFSDDHLEILRSVGRSGHNMLNMINRSLDLYKMETGVYSLAAQSMDLLPVLRSALQEVTASVLAKGKHWVIRLQGNPAEKTDQFWAKAEEMLCYPMFNNLLLNAFEASPEGATVEIELDTFDDRSEIRITNQGAVPQDVRGRFFEKYTTSGKQHGTGLGVYSAKLCVETQQGSIKMEVLEEQRTRITLTLPAMKSEITLEMLKKMFS